MKKTLFLIKGPGQEAEAIPSFALNLTNQEHTEIILLHSGSIPKWSSTQNIMVVDQNIGEKESQEGKNLILLSYQNVLEKVFNVDTALVV